MSELSITQWEVSGSLGKRERQMLVSKIGLISSSGYLPLLPLLLPLPVLPTPFPSSLLFSSSLSLPPPLLFPSSSYSSCFGSFRHYILFSFHPNSFPRNCCKLCQVTIFRRCSKSVSTPSRAWRRDSELPKSQEATLSNSLALAGNKSPFLRLR